MITQAPPALVWVDWPAPAHVKACYTLRVGGVSHAPYTSFNLAKHVGDDEASVTTNRKTLMTLIGQHKISWLQQVHGAEVLAASDHLQTADASVSDQPNQVCCVMTADCLPVFFSDLSGQKVAMAHAGWRGLCAGVLENTLKQFSSASQVLCYLGPAISQPAFEVGDDVHKAFSLAYPHLALSQQFDKADNPDKWLCSLYGIATLILNSLGVAAVSGGERCTFSEQDAFFSYRRDGQTGRMANLIWIDA
ncbi:MAG: peptidoglycan editing factor PgeF [Pseudomonadota bacterium]